MKEELDLDGIIVRGLNEWEEVDFSDVRTIKEFKKKLIDNYVILCRKCAAFRQCKFRNRKEDKCGLSVRFIGNYIDNTIKSITIQDSKQVRDYIISVISLLNIIERYENWKGTNINDDIAKWWGPYYPKHNLWYAYDVLENIAKYINTYHTFDLGRVYRYKVIVEGDSEYQNLSNLLGAINAKCYISINNIVNLRGAGNSSPNRIELLLNDYQANSTRVFIILDNDLGTKRLAEKLIKKKLIAENDVILFRKTFEDSFPPEIIKKSFDDLGIDELKLITLNEIKKVLNSRIAFMKGIDKILRSRNSSIKLSDYKTKYAKILTDNLIVSLEKGVLKNKRSEIVVRLKLFAKNFVKENLDFYYPTRSIA